MRISDWSSDVCSSDLLPGQACIDLITGRHEERYSGSGRVWGVYALDEKSGEVHAHVGRATILASGGAGRVYQFSTAPRGATGDGIAMAWRAGCRVSNMEMMQRSDEHTSELQALLR